MTFNFDAPESHASTPPVPAAARRVESDETVRALARDVASYVVIVASSG